jgi:peptidoglycan/LPS O-acetylase OafA/YrhL
MGRISYGVYLWHVPLLMAAGTPLDRRISAALAAVAVAWVSWVVIERPILLRRDRDWNRLGGRRAGHAPREAVTQAGSA